MSTQALIAAMNSNGNVVSTTVNWDGDTLADILTGYYNSVESAFELINHGAISSLGIRINPIGEHSFNEREEGTTTFYHRDRGEELQMNQFICYDDFADYIEDAVYDKYIYFFDGNQWVMLQK